MTKRSKRGTGFGNSDSVIVDSLAKTFSAAKWKFDSDFKFNIEQ